MTTNNLDDLFYTLEFDLGDDDFIFEPVKLTTVQYLQQQFSEIRVIHATLKRINDVNHYPIDFDNEFMTITSYNGEWFIKGSFGMFRSMFLDRIESFLIDSYELDNLD